jgi:nucleoside-diphosphate-sugar epimerase/intein/homing endonuclease
VAPLGRVVVTGGAGFLGSHLCESLLDRGEQVIAIDNLVTGSVANIEHLFGKPGFTFVEHDVSNYVWVPGPVDAVLHFASPASPKDYLEMPIQTLKVGSLGTHNTLGLAKAKGARYLIASTSEVYGDPQVHPQPETYWGHVNPVGPRGVYDEAKRFAEAMTMAYHTFHGLEVRIVRIFNSILADEQVLYDDGTQLRREPVERLAARLAGQVDLDGFSVPAFDGSGRIGATGASALVGHPCQTRCFEVRTRYGRSIRVTGDHSLFVEGPDGTPEPRTVTHLAVGDRIAVARRIEVPERDRTEVDTLVALEAVGLDPWDLAICSPGLGEVVWAHRQELFGVLATDRKPTGPNWRNGIWSRIIRWRRADQLPLQAFRRMGLDIPSDATVRPCTAGRTAKLPTRIAVSDELLWLLGLYVAEGCWAEYPPKCAAITLSAEVELLDRAEKVIERELGLHVVRAEPSAARSASLTVHSVHLLRVLAHLGFSKDTKNIPGWILGLPLRRLGWFLEGYREGYREGDGVHSGAKLAEGVRHEFSTVSDDLKDDLIVAFARFGLVPSVGRYETTLRQRTGDRRYPFWQLTLANVAPWSPLEWHRGVHQELNARTTHDLVWAQVTDITEVEATGLVYDFCVPGRENFWAGTGVMAHNTYGPRMRPGDGRVVSNFLVQAIRGEPLTIYGDGTQTRSFCYVDDEVRGILALLDSDTTGPVNIGNPGEFTMVELAEQVRDVTGSSSEIVFEPLPVDDPTQRRPDLTVATRELGWAPEIPLREGLERTAPYFRRILGA